MPFIDTNEGWWVNSAHIIAIQRGPSHAYTPLRGEFVCHTWELTVITQDGKQYRLTEERAALAVHVLELPDRLAFEEMTEIAECVAPDGSPWVERDSGSGEASTLEEEEEGFAGDQAALNLFADFKSDAAPPASGEVPVTSKACLPRSEVDQRPAGRKEISPTNELTPTRRTKGWAQPRPAS